MFIIRPLVGNCWPFPNGKVRLCDCNADMYSSRTVCVSAVTLCLLTTGSLFTAVCTGALAHTLAALRFAQTIRTQHFPQSAGCYMFYTHVHICTYKQKKHKSEPCNFFFMFLTSNLYLFYLIWLWQKNTTTSHKQTSYSALTAFSLIPSIRAILNSITHLPQRDTTSISTAKLARTSWRHTATKYIAVLFL